MRKNYFLFAALAGALVAQQAVAQCTCFTMGTGADGVYHATSSDTLLGGSYNFSSFTIDAGVTINVRGSQPLVIHCTGAVQIDGLLDASGGNGTNGITSDTNGFGGMGYAGGMNGGDGVYSSTVGPLSGSNGGGTGGGGMGNGWSGGGGGGYAAVGDSSHGVGGFGGAMYGMTDLSDCMSGSGGAGGSGGYACGSGGGGAGGGFLTINAMSITISATGSIHANGGNGGSDGTGNCGGGGGGSGGSIWLAAPSIIINGAVSATGGLGGSSTVPGNPYYGGGGNGAPGRIRVDFNTPGGVGTVNPTPGFVNPNLSAMAVFAFPIDSACAANAQITLTGSPAGGTFSGTAVTGNTFNPSMATPNAYSYVTYTYVDSTCGTTFSTTDSIYVGTCLGVNQMPSGGMQLSAVPNPNNGSFQLQISGLKGATSLHLRNALGQELKNWSVETSSATVLVNQLSSGIYFITADNEAQHITQKVVVQ